MFPNVLLFLDVPSFPIIFPSVHFVRTPSRSRLSMSLGDFSRWETWTKLLRKPIEFTKVKSVGCVSSGQKKFIVM